MKTAVVLPVLNPDEKFAAFVERLIESGYETILAINDGSAEEYVHYFDEAAVHPQVTVLVHEVNKGKGAALKTAFRYLHENLPEIDAAITCDGDGQHTVESMKACLDAFEEHPGSVIIGGRDFDSANIPPRSRFGNKISSVIYRFACGIKLKDTQTGLRVIPASCFEGFSQLAGDRYEYETHMLIEIVNRNVPYYEVPIETIYIDDNESSHFNPLKDSFRIYKVVLKYFFKFILSSISSWVVDIGVYWITIAICGHAWNLKDSITEASSLAGALLNHSWNLNIAAVLIATLTSRITSSIVNFIINRKVVFKDVSNVRKTATKYFTLAVCQMILSFLLVDLIANGLLHVTGFLNVLIKCVVDMCLFVFSYGIQRKWVFKDKR